MFSATVFLALIVSVNAFSPFSNVRVATKLFGQG